MRRFNAVALMALAVVAGAHAAVFNVVSVGTFTLDGGTGYSTDESVVFQMTPSALDTLDFDAVYVGAGAAGTMVYTGAGGTVTLAFTSGDFSFGGSGSSISGAWSYVSGTGDYAGYASGAGTWGAAYDAVGSYASTTLAGNLEPVPEPASLAVVGIGAAALLRRRRRA